MNWRSASASSRETESHAADVDETLLYSHLLIAVIFATVALMCAVGATFLTIYYVTAYDRDSNFSVMYEEYTDSLCRSSPSASMPRRIFSIPHASTECTRMSVTGETAGVVFADGRCDGSGGSYKAILRTGGTFLTCMDAPDLHTYFNP